MLKLKKAFIEEIRQQGRAEWPNEACGYLLGRDESSLDERFPMTNVDKSPEHFSFEPVEQFAALKQARNRGKSLLAVYHTHPETPARMSVEDIRLANDVNMTYFIYSHSDDRLKAFRISRDKEVREVDYEFFD